MKNALFNGLWAALMIATVGAFIVTLGSGALNLLVWTIKKFLL